MTTTRQTQFAEGYQTALFDLMCQLMISRNAALEWIVNNTTDETVCRQVNDMLVDSWSDLQNTEAAPGVPIPDRMRY